MKKPVAKTRPVFELVSGSLFVNGERATVVPSTVKRVVASFEAQTGIRFGRPTDDRTTITEELGRSILESESDLSVRQMQMTFVLSAA